MYLVRVEAVNFGSFILDTSDLSTRRGGGLLLLDIELSDFAKERNLGEPVSRGASIVHYIVGSDRNAGQLCADIEAYLAARPAFQEASIFAVFAPMQDEDDWNDAINHARSLIRWDQLSRPSVVYPELNLACGPNGDAAIDEIDGVRPGRVREDFVKPPKEGETQGEGWVVSDVTYYRRKTGVEKKHKDYATRFALPPGLEYVNDMEQLSTHPGKGLLNRKIGVIYLDGNKFGARFAAARGSRDYSALSRTIQANQKSFMHWLLQLRAEGAMTSWHWSGDVWTNRGNKVRKERAFRIETLLWGGDEIMWVVPAWCAWWMLDKFFATYGTLPFPNEQPSQNPGGEALTHAGSIVFCHHNAPISRIAKLARALADSAKEAAPGQNSVRYQVLESFDHLGADPTAARVLRLPPLLRRAADRLRVDPSVFSPRGMEPATQVMNDFRLKFPRSKLHRILLAYESNAVEADCLAAEELKRAELETEFTELQDYLAPPFELEPDARNALAWTHIAELWDYTPIPDWQALPVPNGGSEQ